MSMIYQTDPNAREKLLERLAELQDELRGMQEQNRRAKELGHPRNPPGMVDSLRSRIRQTRKRLVQLTEARDREGSHV